MIHRLGIVLSGGGARGVAHAGVLKALHEHGIRPDCIAGSSAGALVGALYAAGHGFDEILDFFLTRSPITWSKFTLRKPGWIDTDKVITDFLEYFPEDRFEALQTKLFVATTDLLAGQPVVFDSGPLIRAVLASCSVPPIFTPVTIDGRPYADGGITNNFPVEPLLGRCRRLLGVYASPMRAVSPHSLGSSLAVWQRALEVGMFSAAKSKFAHCGHVICPEPLTEYGLFDTKQVKRIFDVGYDATLAQMESLQAMVTE